MNRVMVLVSSTPSIFFVRIVGSLVFCGIQFVVLRAFLRVLKSMGFSERRERLGVVLGAAIFGLINLPLLGFIVETFVSPRSFFLYSPAPGYERLIRPVSYVFFVWTIGSFFLVAAAPAAMFVFALIQFVGRKKNATSGGLQLDSNAKLEGTRDSTMPAAVDLSRRRFLQMMLLAAATMPFAVSAYGAIAARSRKVVEHVTVPIDGLPEPLDGFTIVQMSDIHSGFFMKESMMREQVEIANSLNPDVVALTGDFVATDDTQVAPFMRAMAGLRARYGVFGCLGNHDMFTNSEAELERQFHSAGFKLLRGANQVIEVGGARLNIIGVDYIFGSAYGRLLDAALRGISLEGITVLLLHAPYAFPEAARKGINLTLSGHTHGGQIALRVGDFILTPARLSTIFLAGLFKIGGSYLYVNRGLGTTGPPIRIGSPPEITHITLKRA